MTQQVNAERLKAMWRRGMIAVEPGMPAEGWARGWNAAYELACQDLDREIELAAHYAEKARRIERLVALADVEPRDWTPSIDADFR